MWIKHVNGYLKELWPIVGDIDSEPAFMIYSVRT